MLKIINYYYYYGEKNGGKKEKEMTEKIVATMSLPAVDRPNAYR